MSFHAYQLAPHHLVENLPTIRDWLVISFCSPWPQFWVEYSE